LTSLLPRFQESAIHAMDTVIDARSLSKLRWRCRRGMLENDLFIERFFVRHEASLTQAQAQGLLMLMDLPDNDLLDLLLARKEPEAELASADVVQVLSMMRVSQQSPNRFVR
jgi:antitoxin CptB